MGLDDMLINKLIVQSHFIPNVRPGDTAVSGSGGMT
jgi:hypothetical protein